MRKAILILTLVMGLFGCKKEDDSNTTVPIDMTLSVYSADAKFRSLPVVLQLRFQSDGTVQLKSFPAEDVVTLKYEVGDRSAASTKLRIYGELDKTLYVDGFTQGTRIDWTSEISRLNYSPEIVGFTAGDYHFTSY